MVIDNKESESKKIKKALIEYFTLSDDNADNKVCDIPVRDVLDWLKKQGEPEWNDEDEYNFNTILHILDLRKELYRKEGNQEIMSKYQGLYEWLKLSKNKIQPNQWKPNKKQMYILNWVANILLSNDGLVDKEASKILDSLYNDLKKI